MNEFCDTSESTFGFGFFFLFLKNVAGLKAAAKVEEQKARLKKVVGYTELEQEALYENEAKEKQLKSWPSKGEVKFDHLYVRYSESDEPVLANLDFIIEAGSKVR